MAIMFCEKRFETGLGRCRPLLSHVLWIFCLQSFIGAEGEFLWVEKRENRRYHDLELLENGPHDGISYAGTIS